MSSLHDKIMNIQADFEREVKRDHDLYDMATNKHRDMLEYAFKVGHRQGRHEAAEMALSEEDARIRPIRSKDDYKAALWEVAKYFENEPTANTVESDRFEILLILIDEYEQDMMYK